jgi:hypothetical protein
MPGSYGAKLRLREALPSLMTMDALQIKKLATPDRKGMSGKRIVHSGAFSVVHGVLTVRFRLYIQNEEPT